MKITVPSYKCAEFVAFLTQLAFPILSWALISITHCMDLVLLLGESCKTTLAAAVWVLARRDTEQYY